MYLFSRTAMLRGPQQETMQWATEITDRVNAVTHIDTTLWQGLFGAPLGTVAWSARVDSHVALAGVMGALGSDQQFMALSDRGLQYTNGPVLDSMSQLVHQTGSDLETPPLGACAQLISATPAEGRIGDAMRWGTEIADYFASITHIDVLMLTATYGDFGDVLWLARFPTLADVDATQEILGKDEEYVARIDRAGDLFQPGTAKQRLFTRVH